MELIEKGTPQDLKTLNKKAILHCIRHSSRISRAEISKRLNISKPTVSLIVEELIDEGWIVETGSGQAKKSGGRRPIQIQFNENAGYVIGVDIGGTKVMAAVSNLKGKILRSKTFSTEEYLQSGLLEQLKLTVNDIVADVGIQHDKILGMGIGVPGITNVDSGIVVDAPSLGWMHFPLKDKAENLFGFPVFIDNDVNVSALGEQWLGAARDKDCVLLISIGTGVGCGIILNGKLFRGAKWAAGEIGYMVTDKNQTKKRNSPPFPGYGFLDSHVGGPSIRDRMSDALVERPDHPLYEKKDTLTAREIFEFAINEDKLANEIVSESIEHLSFAIVNAATLFNPEIILLGGGISKSGYWFLPKVKETVTCYVPFETQISLTQLEDQSGVVGAVSLFLREQDSVLEF